jgi:plasmid stability protein
MTNLTITVDEQTLKKARIRALEEGTSVNAVLRDYLETYAGVRREQLEAARRILADARKGGTGSGPGGRKWTREELYDREGLRE